MMRCFTDAKIHFNVGSKREIVGKIRFLRVAGKYFFMEILIFEFVLLRYNVVLKFVLFVSKIRAARNQRRLKIHEYIVC